MWRNASHLVPVVNGGVVLAHPGAASRLDVITDGTPVGAIGASGLPSICFVQPPLEGTFTVELVDSDGGTAVVGSPVTIRIGGWQGAVRRVRDRFVSGYAQDRYNPGRDVTVVAYSGSEVLAFATARAEKGGQFLLVLPADVVSGPGRVVQVGIAGSDFLLHDGTFGTGTTGRVVRPSLRRVARPMTVAIKISTPNLRVAHEWGDYHFANSLRASFEKIGVAASVDTHDTWYDPTRDADVVIALRGRQPYQTDPSKINLMWLISHPDRVVDGEMDGYDHVYVASDVYARTLRLQGLPSVGVLHQATDHRFFHPFDDIQRDRDCLFVGNSRREYRTMVRWCIERKLPLALYGGGWDGILPGEMVRAENIPNAELARHYASHLILLNDHWDTMRDSGFPSNRLFDGSGVGTPIITDAVGGLADVFGDTISVAHTVDDLEAIVADALSNPEPYLRRAEEARAIVLANHTFDHRAEEIRSFVEQHEKFALLQGRGSAAA
ncbi:CgeB family protein [Ensifer soli]|uniref:CgeB family protein n=1 Tax=Ciceribacter sp. sgz301302 TaxID=3342379 RepID=UPI0035BA3C32